MRDTPAPDQSRVIAAALTAWLVPGAAHAVYGETRKALVFFAAITTMFVVGIAAGGRLFPLDPADPLVFLEAVAEWLVGVPRLIAAFGDLGAGQITAVTYEYGNTFLIAAGLLNALVMLDAVDLATGRKTRA